MGRISVGFVGSGGIARSHTKALVALGNVDFVAFCDIVKERAQAYADEYGGRVYTDFGEMYDKEELDAVYVCLPPFAHTNEVQLAAERGINVFIQKPIALDMDLAKSMVDAVERAGVKSQVGYQLRFGKGIQMGKSLIGEDTGEVTLAVGRYLCNFIGGEWWRDPSKSGGQVVEQSTHVVDLLRYLCGDIASVSSEMDTLYWSEVEDMAVEDVSATSMRFRSGAIGSMVVTTGGYAGKWIADISVFTKKAVLDFPDPNTLSVSWTADNGSEEHRFPSHDMTLAEARHFIGAIENDLETITPISEGARTLAVTLAIRESGIAREPREIAP